MKTGRRTFIKTVAAGSAAAQMGGAQSTPPYAYPRVYSDAQLRMIAFPLGGIGAGSISLGGRGQLRDWEIFNKADKGRRPRFAFGSIWAQAAGQDPVAYVLESQIQPPYEGAFGLGSDNVPGLPRLAQAQFTGEYPMAKIEFADPHLPVVVTLEAFTPFIPLDEDASGLPVAFLRYRVHNPGAVPVSVSIAYSLDNPVGDIGRQCLFGHGTGWQGLLFTNPFLPTIDPMFGSFVVGVLSEREAHDVSHVRGWRESSGWPVGPLLFWDHFSKDGTPGPEPTPRSTVGTLALKRDIAPNETSDFTFLLAWYFPTRTPKRCGARAAEGQENTAIGNYYCSRFGNAWAAAEFAVTHLESYERRTRAFLDAMRRTTLPDLVKDGAMSNLSTLVTQTSFRTLDGRFHGFEGCTDSSGCCEGSCTHVWNYETATAHLFPGLSRSLREASFGFDTDDGGLMSFRELLPSGKQRWGLAAADGQMGQIMHLYLDWRLSGNTEWLRSLWPAAKRAIEFAWIPGGWDSNRDGVMEGTQHNTYDVEFFGPNPLCGVWYLGALRAAEEMARALDDRGAQHEYRRLFRNGSSWIDAHLFNGEYYIQKVTGAPRDRIAAGLIVGMGARDTEHPDFQMGEGCLIDQLVGQYMAHICGLGLLLGESNVHKTAASIYRYNYKRRLDRHASVQRTYALNDEAGMIICDYGKVARPEVPFPYFAELMTGFEYAAAVLMIFQGMVDEGVECIGNIRKRYDGERRNPYDEAECGHHYARAMASWSAIPALSGWNYDAVAGTLHISPRAAAPGSQPFESFWSAGTGWGTFSYTASGIRRLTVTVSEGSLACQSLQCPWSASAKSVTIAGHPAPFRIQGAVIAIRPGVVVKPGEELQVTA